MAINIIFIVSLIGLAFLGYMLGFGRSLKIATKGIFGIAIAIAVCVMLGGTVMNITAVAGFIDNIDKYFGSLWSFLGYLYLGTVLYYICFFIVIQLLRIIFVKIICKVESKGGKGVKVVSRALGAAFVVSFCFGLCLLTLAGFKAFETTEFTANIVMQIEDSFQLRYT